MRYISECIRATSQPIFSDAEQVFIWKEYFCFSWCFSAFWCLWTFPRRKRRSRPAKWSVLILFCCLSSPRDHVSLNQDHFFLVLCTRPERRTWPYAHRSRHLGSCFEFPTLKQSRRLTFYGGNARHNFFETLKEAQKYLCIMRWFRSPEFQAGCSSYQLWWSSFKFLRGMWSLQ
jgi:hypothetical protein